MAAATVTTGTLGRGNVIANASLILVTVTGVATTYTNGTGLPIDLVTVLQTAAPSGFDAPNYIQALNPADIIGMIPNGISTNGFLPTGFTVGTPAYSAPPWVTGTNASAVPGILTSCPATIKLTATGAASNGAFGELITGANSDTFSFWLVIARNGANS